MVNPDSIDSLNAIIFGIQKISNFQLNKDITIITFNEIFWR